MIRRRSHFLGRLNDFARDQSRGILCRRKDVVQPDVGIPNGERVSGLALQIRVQRTPRIDIPAGPHHLDRAARDVAPTEPDHSADPIRHGRGIEQLPRPQRVEVAGQHVERERTLLLYQLLLNPVEETAQLAGTLPLTPLGEPGTEVKDKKARESIGKPDLEQCMTRPPRVAPRVLEYGDTTEEPGRMR